MINLNNHVTCLRNRIQIVKSTIPGLNVNLEAYCIYSNKLIRFTQPATPTRSVLAHESYQHSSFIQTDASKWKLRTSRRVYSAHTGENPVCRYRVDRLRL